MTKPINEISLDDLVPMSVWRIAHMPERGEKSVVILREDHGEGLLPIAVGLCEAAAIEKLLEAKTTGRLSLRPFTHELLATVIERLDGSVERGIVTRLEHETFFARLVLRRGDEEWSVDARPSDVVSVVLASGARLYAGRDLIEQVSGEA